MSCKCDIKVDRKANYNSVELFRFFTTNGVGLPDDNTQLANYLTNSLCDVTNSPEERRLELQNDISFLSNLDEIYIENIEFIAFDFINNYGEPLDEIFQPNFFTPRILINQIDVCRTSSVSTNKAIGIPLPYCMSINKVIKEPKTIAIYSSFAKQLISGGVISYQNYPLQAIMRLYHNN